jgi:hypothetical protein
MIVLWEPMFPGDARSKIPTAYFDDPRVESFWDPTEISGRWFGARAFGGLQGIVWDAYYAFAPTAHWGTGVPSHLLAAGSDIIGSTNGLQHSFVPLLGKGS